MKDPFIICLILSAAGIFNLCRKDWGSRITGLLLAAIVVYQTQEWWLQMLVIGSPITYWVLEVSGGQSKNDLSETEEEINNGS